MHCLVTHFPMIFGDLAKTSKDLWDCIATLLSIMQIVFSFSIKQSEIADLEKLIPKHMNLVKSFFKVELIRKYHLLVHYPNNIRKMGAPMLYTVMRYEGKHKYFKSIAKNTNNFKNITKTMAMRHQESVSNRAFDFGFPLILGKKTKLSGDLSAYGVTKFDSSEIFRVNFLKHNCLIRPSFFIYLNDNFFKINHIILFKEEIKLQGIMYKFTYYKFHCAYMLGKEMKTSLISYKTLEVSHCYESKISKRNESGTFLVKKRNFF